MGKAIVLVLRFFVSREQPFVWLNLIAGLLWCLGDGHLSDQRSDNHLSWSTK